MYYRPFKTVGILEIHVDDNQIDKRGDWRVFTLVECPRPTGEGGGSAGVTMKWRNWTIL